MFRRLGLSLLLVPACWIALAGCASYNARPLQLRSAAEYPAHTQGTDLVAGAEALDTAEKSSAVLGVDISGEYVAVELVLDNAGGDKWVVDRSTAKMKCAGGRKTLDAVASQSIFVQYKNDLGGAYAVGGTIGLSAASNANEAMRADWSEKEIPAQFILGPSQRKGGILFFRGTCGNDPRTITLAAERVASGNALSLEIDLGAGPKREPKEAPSSGGWNSANTPQ
jgi:hypothetical protein